MRYDDAIRRLDAAFGRPLPGASAHERLAPRPRRSWPPNTNPARIRNAAALLLLYPDAGSTSVVLTLRADTLGRHGGQVSLPGGVVDPGETFEQAALREAREEIALDEPDLRILGALTPLDIPVSGFRLHPTAAAVPRRPALKPADGEVAAILYVDLDRLADPASLVERPRERDGIIVAAPAFVVGTVEIWGATAMILAELLALLGSLPEPRQ